MAPKFKIETQNDELEQFAKRPAAKRSPEDEGGHQEQPVTKRLAKAPLNFSIESIMQPSQQANHQNGPFVAAKRPPTDPAESRSPSPASDAGSRSSSRSSASTLASGNSENGAYDEGRAAQKGQVQQIREHSNGNHLNKLESNSLINDGDSFVSSNSSSRVSSPISPGCNASTGNQQHSRHNHHHHHHHHHHSQSHSRNPKHHQSSQHSSNSHHQSQHEHHQSSHSNHNQHLNQPLGSFSTVASPLRQAQSPSYAGHSSSRFQQAGTSSSAAGNHANASQSSSGCGASGSTGRLNQVECVLDNKEMWDKFHSLNTEMIITKTGRRMFPVLKVQFHNLDPTARYAVSMDIVPVDNKRYRYAYHKSCWQPAGKADPSAEPRLYPHPDSPFNGDLLSRQVISFEKVKLTNNEMDKSGHIILNSMHKYQPRVHLIELKSTLVAPPPQQQVQQINPLNGKLNPSRYQQQQQRTSCQPQPQLDIEGYRTFVFPETVFTAVTAYQNQLITKMKIDKNPFAKGFRDSSRLSDLDRNDPFEGFMGLGPAAAAAAAACAVGRFPGGPPGSAGAGNMPPGSLEAAAVAAGMQPGNPGQMDQAYAQLLASAAAANSPWYSAAAAAAAANSSPFGPMGPSAAAACSTAQAAQQLQATQMWLAAFSACLNNGQLPPPPGGTMNHEPSEAIGQLQECRGDSRNSG